MKYPEFALETFLAEREFCAPFNLCASDLETHTMSEIVEMADKGGVSGIHCLKVMFPS